MTREQFISNISSWNSFLPMLWEALEETHIRYMDTVVELGMGDGSTKKLHEYCRYYSRPLFSYESDMIFYRQFEQYRTDQHAIEYVGTNWEVFQERHREPIGVLFSDEAPGHMRKYNISMYATLAQVIVVHDADESTDHGYRLSWVKPLFKYHALHEYPGASTAVFSNFIDVTKWAESQNKTSTLMSD